jgi:hypothetical protein
VQRFATPQWGRVTPFALTSASQFAPPLLNRAKLPDDARQLVDIQARLTDEQKTIACHWADGPGSELPPGHWAMIAQAASWAGGLGLDVNAKGFFALGNALLDASIATWNTKVVQDTVRPITYIRWLYKGKGEDTSGDSAFSGASQRVFNLVAQIGSQAWAKAQAYFNGTAATP